MKLVKESLNHTFTRGNDNKLKSLGVGTGPFKRYMTYSEALKLYDLCELITKNIVEDIGKYKLSKDLNIFVTNSGNKKWNPTEKKIDKLLKTAPKYNDPELTKLANELWFLCHPPIKN